MVSGALSGVLQAATYFVTGNIYVNEGDSLIIEPGAVLQFMDSPSMTYTFTIEGYLGALGTVADSIKFIPYAGVPIWGGIDFSSQLVVSRLLYCLITNANSAGVRVDNSSPALEHCTIRYCWGGGFYCTNGSQPTLQYCDISYNAWSGGGGVIVDPDRMPQLNIPSFRIMRSL